ncbi:MAG TPA: hypothetical protein VEJ63_24470 [Planctomycetota bacterium]|nr:hypothetical protein [Planctomycetota bacterium]
MPVEQKGEKSQPLYFVNAWVDYALIGGGSILIFTLLRQIYTTDRTPLVTSLGFYLLWIVNWPHFSATSYRLYSSRDNIMQYPLTALVVPWLVLAAVISSIASPEVIAPIFIKFYLVWSPYHFSGQTVGITLIYARRAGFQVGAFERFCLSGFVFGTFLSSTMRGEVEKGNGEYHGIFCPSLCLPEWMWTATQAFMGVFGILFLALAIRWCIQNRRILPPIVLVPALTQLVWFLPDLTYPSFAEFVPFFHSLQYLLIAWAMQLKEKMDREKIEPSSRYVAMETLRWGGLNVAGGILLFYGITVALWLFQRGWNGTDAALCLSAIAGGVLWKSLPKSIVGWAGLCYAVGVVGWLTHHAIVSNDAFWPLTFGVVSAGVQVHHFFVDGVIWKLKRKTVASPLMVNIDEMLHARPSAAHAPLVPAGVLGPTPVAAASEQRA